MITFTSIRSVVANKLSRTRLRNAILQSMKFKTPVYVTNKHGVISMYVVVKNDKLSVFDSLGNNITSVFKKGLGLN